MEQEFVIGGYVPGARLRCVARGRLREQEAQVKTVSCREFAMSSRRALPFGGVTPVPARGTASPDAARLELPTPHDCPCRLAHRSETGDIVTVRVERRRTAKPYSFLLRCAQSGVHTLANDLTLEFGHRAQNVKLQLASRIPLSRSWRVAISAVGPRPFLSLRETRGCLCASAVCSRVRCLREPRPLHRLTPQRCDPPERSRARGCRGSGVLRQLSRAC